MCRGNYLRRVTRVILQRHATRTYLLLLIVKVLLKLLRLDCPAGTAPRIEILLLLLRIERHPRLVGRRRQGVGRLQELRRGRVGVHAVVLHGEAVLAVIVAVGGIAGWNGNKESGEDEDRRMMHSLRLFHPVCDVAGGQTFFA